MRPFVLAAAVLCLATASPALACSVRADYRVPTNLELTTEADLVMVARVESGSIGFDGPDEQMTVTPVEVLKGSIPLGKPMQVMGSIAPPRFAVLSPPLQLHEAHPTAYMGSCYRTMFVKDVPVLFFLTPAEKAFDGEVPAEMRGMLVPAGGPFSRWAEDVVTQNAPWLRATRVYLKVAALPKEQQNAALRAEHDALLRAGDQDSKVIAEDIARQLEGPNKPWNEIMQEEVKKMEERRKERDEERVEELTIEDLLEE